MLGSKIDLDGIPRTVLGVTEEGFQFPPGDAEAEMYFPMALSDAVLLDRDHRMFDAFARLASGVGVEAANAELLTLAAKLAILGVVVVEQDEDELEADLATLND